MDLGLAGRTALVCASTGGLGESIARALGEERASVVVSGRRGDRAAQIAGELPNAIGVEIDLLEPDAPQRLVSAAVDAFGSVDVLVLNGPGPKPSMAVDVTEADLDEAINRLVRPHLALLSLVLPGMRERGWGRIVAVGSSGVAAPIPNLDLSNLGRAALAGHLKTLAAEVAADGVTVNMVLPGRIETDRVAALDAVNAERNGRSPLEERRASCATIPVGRYGQPAEFGAAAAFLCSESASYITGITLRCDGGLVRSN